MTRFDNKKKILTIHAHPDDESSKGAPTIAYYKNQGYSATLVTCTQGDAGEVLNPSLVNKIERKALGFHRFCELIKAASIIGYDKVITLNYKDSGMPGAKENKDPRAFSQQPINKIVTELVTIIRSEQPQVIISYGADQKRYPHPDHIMVHQASLLAYLQAPNPNFKTGELDPFKPLKLYYHVFSLNRLKKIHQWLVGQNKTSPFTEQQLQIPTNVTEPTTTLINVANFLETKRQALLCHASQIDPDKSPFFIIDVSVESEIFPFEEYHLAHCRVGKPTEIEHDLFQGIT